MFKTLLTVLRNRKYVFFTPIITIICFLLFLDFLKCSDLILFLILT
jgi:hypothetical protein